MHRVVLIYITMTVRKGDIVELHVDRVAFGGQGIARLDGLVIFVNGAVPGDRVRALLFRKKKAYAEARIEEILVPSSDRIQAPCPYFGTCGGCQWQHLTYERQPGVQKGQREGSPFPHRIRLRHHGSRPYPLREALRLPEQNGVFLFGPAVAPASTASEFRASDL